MTSMWVDDTDVEAAEYDDSETEELFGATNWHDCQAEWEDCNAECEAEWEDNDAECEDCKAQCAAALAECVAARARRRRPRRPDRRSSKARSSVQRATATAVRKLDLETKVQEATFHRTITAQSNRMSLSEYAAAAGAAVNQFIESFDAPKNPYARAALRFSPLLLLSPQPKGRGVDGLIQDPRVIGAAAVAAVVLVGENRNESRKPRDIRIFAPDALESGDHVVLVADVVDGRGAVLPAEKVTWDSSDEKVAQFEADSDVVEAISGGTAVISATSGDIVRRHLLTVTSP
jgi:hypothetical protein